MRAGIALGSNVGDRLSHLRLARRSINELPQVAPPEKVSRIYETEPLPATPGAGRFLNAIIEIEYDDAPIVLLDAMQSIERLMGRASKRPRNAPRTIDLDILYVGNMVLNNEEVMIPHPRLHLREFVLAPLAEIRPELLLPGQQASIAELLAKIRQPNAIRLFEQQWE